MVLRKVLRGSAIYGIDINGRLRYTMWHCGGGGMADALVSEASAARHEGSTPSSRTIIPSLLQLFKPQDISYVQGVFEDGL